MEETISQTIYDYIELSRETKKPILLISNPGFGKTTSITNWAKENNYHYEQLIGSRFSPDDIMGYQVNEPGSPTLVQKDPVWFQRIIDAKKSDKPTILFVDEISTCNEDVQGSLLSLIFDRRIGNGKELPEDCIIMAAANYSENLPSYMNIMAPTINRFCIINLLQGFSNSDIIHECLTVRKPLLRTKISVNVDEIEKQFNKMFNDIIIKYSFVDSNIGYIDLQNHDISNIYKRKGNVYNIISWRSVTYLKEFIIAMTRLGICDMNVIKNVCGGLIGLGSNNFKTEDQVEAFINLVSESIKQIIDSNYSSNEIENFSCENKSISDLINDYIIKLESTNTLGVSKIENYLVDMIVKKYGNFEETFNNLKDQNINSSEFVSDMDSIALIIPKLSTDNAKIVSNIHQSCSPMYNDLLGIVTSGFQKTIYGIYCPMLIKQVILGTDKDGTFRRIGVFGSSENSYVIIPNGVNVCDANLTKIIKRENFTINTLDRILV